MRVWRYQGIHRVAWVVVALAILAVAVFAMAAGFVRLRGEVSPAGDSAKSPGAGALLLSPGSLGSPSGEPPVCALVNSGDLPVSI
jgi:hypothetical protein